jgi:DNA primase
VATDNDQAGHIAAHRAFWQLAARGEDPRQLLLPPGTDPAELFQTHGPQALRVALDGAPPLAERIIADRTALYTDQLDTIEGRIHTLRQAADVIGALPPSRWHDRAQTTAQQLGVAPSTALNEVLDAGHAWTEDPRGRARQRLVERLPEPASRPTPLLADSAARWAALASRLTHFDVAIDPHWPVLAEHLTRADATGYDVANRLQVLISQQPLPTQHGLCELDLRLINDWPGCLPPTNPSQHRDNQAQHDQAAAHRKTVADEHTAHDQLQPPPTASTATPAPTARPPQPTTKRAAPPPRPGPSRP